MLETQLSEEQRVLLERWAAAQKTPYGLTVSPHYLRQSRAQKEQEEQDSKEV